MRATEEMRSAAHKAWKDTVLGGKSAEMATEAAITAALALVPGEPVLYGPYGYLNGNRALSEDEWTLENDPIENSEEYFSIPLFAKVDIFSAAPQPSVDRDALLEEARRVIEPWAAISMLILAEAPADALEFKLFTDCAGCKHLIPLDSFRAAITFLSKLESSHAEA